MAFDGSRAEFYRQQAQRLRAKAATYTIAEIKNEIEKVADQWERIADQIARGIIQPERRLFSIVACQNLMWPAQKFCAAMDDLLRANGS